MQVGFISNKKYQGVALRRSMQGQALIEFAIILILLILVVAGGAELAITAYGSSKVSDAAKAGGTEWGQMISHANDSQRNGTCIGNEPCTNITVTGVVRSDITGSVQGEFSGSLTGIVTNLTPSTSTGDVVGDVSGEITDSVTGVRYTVIAAVTGTLSSIGTTPEGVLTGTLTDGVFVSGTFTDVDNPTNTIPAVTFTDLITGTLTGSNLDSDKQADVGLGDHAFANFQSPSCVALNGDSADYDDGIPTDRYLLDKKNRDNYQILVDASSATKSIYLFNPMPIDNISCNGTDPNRDGRSRLSILVNGYGLMYNDNGTPNDLSDDTPNPLYVPGLPKANQAMYSMYQQVCLSGNNLQSCENATEILLFPPGKLCLSADPNDEHCPTDDDGYVPVNIGETGYYFFGANNIAPEPASGPGQYIPNLAPHFRPTFQIECQGGDAYDSSPSNMVNCDTQAAPTDVCWNDSNTAIACQLKVHVRYRSIFESFITFGMAELPDSNLPDLPFFYNPSKVGVAGSNSVKGIAGSEIGPIGATGNPTVKPFKDFRGCYESVNPGSLNYQVVSCN